MLSDATYIYALVDSISNKLRYVGKADNPEQRLKRHLGKDIKDGTRRANWLLGLQNKGKKPLLIILERVCNLYWPFHERKWITYYKNMYPGQLTNATEGGDGSFAITEDIRRKISEKAKGNTYCKGRVMSEKHKEALRAWHITHPYSDGFTFTGRTHSEETKAKLRKAWVERRKAGRSQETIEKHATAMRGQKETKQIMSEARKLWWEHHKKGGTKND
jgi:hypothetical protein